MDVKRIDVLLKNNGVEAVRVIFLEKNLISPAYFSLNSLYVRGLFK